MSVKTHTGQTIDGEELRRARNAVAEDLVDLAEAIFREDAYASHVTQQAKQQYRQESLEQADRVRTGAEPMEFWLWQRINTKLTGECVPLFAK